MARAVAHRHMLAIELDAKRPYGVSLLSLMVRVCAGRGRAGGGATGVSMWTRSRKEFVLLFVASSPVWWMFEVINRRTANWEYLGSNHFTTFEYYLLCTISFSTVMPAVFETGELAASFSG